MRLHYLDFDASDEASGRGSFDAMASVPANRLPALLAEVGAVLAWAADAFGPAGATDEDGEWTYALEGVREPDTPFDLAWDARSRQVGAPSPADDARLTVTLTLSGSPGFCDALRERFAVD